MLKPPTEAEWQRLASWAWMNPPPKRWEESPHRIELCMAQAQEATTGVPKNGRWTGKGRSTTEKLQPEKSNSPKLKFLCATAGVSSSAMTRPSTDDYARAGTGECGD